jgi:hypothetical protein
MSRSVSTLTPELHDTPIVFLTALATSHDTGGEMMIAGSTVYVAKPASFVVAQNDDALQCIIAKLVRGVDVREVNVAEIRRLPNSLQNC